MLYRQRLEKLKPFLLAADIESVGFRMHAEPPPKWDFRFAARSFCTPSSREAVRARQARTLRLQAQKNGETKISPPLFLQYVKYNSFSIPFDRAGTIPLPEQGDFLTPFALFLRLIRSLFFYWLLLPFSCLTFFFLLLFLLPLLLFHLPSFFFFFGLGLSL